VDTSEYKKKTKESFLLYKKARKYFAGGVNHNARYYPPYPIFIARARGKHLWDEDGNRYVDYWMGHTSLILGHSPKFIVKAISEQAANGTLYGMSSRKSLELAELISKNVPCAEMIRFCNTGAEATMYATRLARAYTSRKWVIKIEGGWHGYNTQLNKAVHHPFSGKESAGILDEEQFYVDTIRFNDIESSEKVIKSHKNDTALVIVEPVLGAGGCIPAKKEYLMFLREITERYSIVLCFDEIITGFRLALGGAQEYYSVKPDMATLGKIAGGGLPIGVVSGIKEIISLADPTKKGSKFVSIGGGTFSENPLSMTAGIETLRYLEKNKHLYNYISKLGEMVRNGLDRAFSENGFAAHTTGIGSLFMTHFSEKAPENAYEAYTSDREIQRLYGLHQISNSNFLLSAHPSAISTSHTEEDIKSFIESAREFASIMTG
jgi:glutamate-1-semialdehyde 2,1-aminomutase